MPAPELAWWSFLKAVLAEMVTADELDKFHTSQPLQNIPTVAHRRRSVLLDFDQSIEAPDDLPEVGPIVWKGRYILTVFADNLGGKTTQDLMEGTATAPSILALGSRVRDVVDANIRETEADWSWPSITQPSPEEQWPRQALDMILEVTQVLPWGNRSMGTFPAPTVPPVASQNLADLQDVAAGADSGDLLQRVSGTWTPRTAAEASLAELGHDHAIEDLTTAMGLGGLAAGNGTGGLAAVAGATLLASQAVPLRLPLYTTPPVSPPTGGLWLELVSGSIRLYYKRPDTSALVSVVLS